MYEIITVNEGNWGMFTDLFISKIKELITIEKVCQFDRNGLNQHSTYYVITI